MTESFAIRSPALKASVDSEDTSFSHSGLLIKAVSRKNCKLPMHGAP
jgi:hypothetical protein